MQSHRKSHIHNPTFRRSSVSLAESLLRERMRSACFSVSDIKLDPRTGTFLISLSGKLIQFTDHNWPPNSPYVSPPIHCELFLDGQLFKRPSNG